jgi:hypothetical protein
MTRRQNQSHVYVPLVSANCILGADDYRWHGYKKP